MPSVICGFNGFGQLSEICNMKSEVTDQLSLPWTEILPDAKVVGISWNGIVLKKGGKYKFHGLVNDKMSQSVDLIPPSSSPVVSATLNNRFVLLVLENGECWKFITATSKWSQVKISPEADHLVKAVVSDTISLFLTREGKVFDLVNEMEIQDKVIDIACGLEHGVMLTESGSVYTIGTNSRGQLGTGDMEDHNGGPVRLTVLDGLAKAMSISAGGWHSCIVSSTGDLYCWGSNCSGQLSLPVTIDDQERGVAISADPIPVDFLSSSPAVSAACGTAHTIALLGDGTVWGCGRNHWLQLGVKDLQRRGMSFIYKGQPGYKVSTLAAGQWNSLISLDTCDNT